MSLVAYAASDSEDEEVVVQPRGLVSYGSYPDDMDDEPDHNGLQGGQITMAAPPKAPGIVSLSRRAPPANEPAAAAAEATSADDSTMAAEDEPALDDGLFPSTDDDTVDLSVLPPLPSGAVPGDRLERVAKMRAYRSKSGSLNDRILRQKAFRNPSIYELITTKMSIDETGTNFPQEQYDPAMWGPSDMYTQLSADQKAYEAKLTKSRQARTAEMKFTPATRAPPPTSAAIPAGLSEAKEKVRQIAENLKRKQQQQQQHRM